MSITVDQLTNENASGVFDVLAKTVRGQLESEFKSGRITGTEYSKVFVTALDNTMGQAIQFLLQKDISANQADLLVAQRNLTTAQEEAVEAEILLTEANTTKVNREVVMMDKQEDLMDAQIALANKEVIKADSEIELIDAQIDKMAQDSLLTAKQIEVADKNVSVLQAQLANLPKEGVLLDKQALKATEETTFLTQRIKTEKAQILDTVDGVAVAGIVGKQRSLYQAQIDGFSRDAEYKLANLMTNTWTVRRSTDEGTVADSTNKLSDGNIGAVLSKAMSSIGVTPV